MCLPSLVGLTMKMNQSLACLMLALMIPMSAACASRANPAVSPTQTAMPIAATATASPTPMVRATPIAAPGTAPASSDSATPSSVATATPTAAPTLVVEIEDEEECRKACHRIDVNSLFGLGARHQPASHKAYTTCLECHAPLAKPALPATHAGRQDAACPLCHLVN
jgi:hypothetical protein